MINYSKNTTKECFLFTLSFWIHILLILNTVEASPLFFASPFGTTKPPDGELESISIYTTSQPVVGERKISNQPSIYQQLARNALERIVSPVVSHFILATATQSSRLVLSESAVSTTKKPEIVQAIPRKRSGNIETLDEEIPEEENMTNSTMKSETEEGKEVANPPFIKNNPSFNKEHDKPERIVLYPNLEKLEEPSEVDDLNKASKNPFSDTHDSDNEVESIGDISKEQPEDDEDNEENETAPEATTPKTLRGLNRNFSESGLIYVLEILGSIYTLGTGLIAAIFPGSMSK